MKEHVFTHISSWVNWNMEYYAIKKRSNTGCWLWLNCHTFKSATPDLPYAIFVFLIRSEILSRPFGLCLLQWIEETSVTKLGSTVSGGDTAVTKLGNTTTDVYLPIPRDLPQSEPHGYQLLLQGHKTWVLAIALALPPSCPLAAVPCTLLSLACHCLLRTCGWHHTEEAKPMKMTICISLSCKRFPLQHNFNITDTCSFPWKLLLPECESKRRPFSIW